MSWLLWRDRRTPALFWTDEAGGVPCWRMAERTGEGFLEERGLSEGAKVAEACFRRVGIEDIEVDEACRTVTGLLSLLDALRGASWASAIALCLVMVEFKSSFEDGSHARRHLHVVFATLNLQQRL